MILKQQVLLFCKRKILPRCKNNVKAGKSQPNNLQQHCNGCGTPV
jgi:hypothetical protein